MIVYLIHFQEKYKHAGHYLGKTVLAIEERMERHRSNRGARLLEVLNECGIGYKVVRTWPDGSEMRLKGQKNSPRLCPVCRGEITYEGVSENDVSKRLERMS